MTASGQCRSQCFPQGNGQPRSDLAVQPDVRVERGLRARRPRDSERETKAAKVRDPGRREFSPVSAVDGTVTCLWELESGFGADQDEGAEVPPPRLPGNVSKQ